LASGAAENPSAAATRLRQLRFSPDGRYVLAQDDAEVTVLTVHPFAILFRIPTQNATDAQFTPDSREVVFVSSVSHVEQWSIADHTRAALREVRLQTCGKERLSPDGRTLACVDPEGTLRLVDVGSGETVLQREKYVLEFIEDFVSHEIGPPIPTQLYVLSHERVMLYPSLARIDFSPDGRFFLAAPPEQYLTPEKGDPVLAWDTHDRREVRLRGGLRDIQHGSSVDYGPAPLSLQYFVFVAPDRVMISSMWWVRRRIVTARLVAFPSGDLLSKPKLPPGPLLRTSEPGFVIVHPFAQYPLPTPPFEVSRGVRVFRPPAPQAAPANQKKRTVAIEIATGQLIVSDTPALDVLGHYYVAEPSPGMVGLYERGKGLQATVVLHDK
jgi:hypothetical protein